MIKSRHPGPPFVAGDEVVMAIGSHQGTPGVFVKLRADPNWADILERDGQVRSHPLQWMVLASSRAPVKPASSPTDLPSGE